jgi:hypothetical protein
MEVALEKLAEVEEITLPSQDQSQETLSRQTSGEA